MDSIYLDRLWIGSTGLRKKKLAKQNISVSPQSLFKAIEMGDVQNTFLLLEAGIDINVSMDRRAPLMSAVLDGSYELVDILLKSGANPNLKNIKNETAFSIAQDKNNEKILRLLEKAKS